MADIQTINDYFEEVYSELNTLIISDKDNLYDCRVFQQPPNNPYLPHIQLTLENINLGRMALDKYEKMYPFVITTTIYSEDTDLGTKQKVGRTVQNKVSQYMIEEKGLKLDSSQSILNLDTNVYRILMRFSGLYDIDNQIVYAYE